MLVNGMGVNSLSDFWNNENADKQLGSNQPNVWDLQNYPNSLAVKRDTNIFISANRFLSIAPPVEDAHMNVDVNDHSPKPNLTNPTNAV